ncbi:MAG TPA: argininosuccinate synthase [Actinomycetota bacterium]|nr:argininosuccinate synthase [Actinomycetota bacterium]
MANKVVLAYSGGLDTTVAVAWLKEQIDADVVAVAVDVGQGGDLEAVRERALKAGASDSHLVDARDEFAAEYVSPALKANAMYQQKYPLVSALSRPLIAKHLARVAREQSAEYVAHGCTGKGNDQVRFEVALGALAPDLEVLAPVREWGMTRADAIDYGLEHGLPITVNKASPYSIDQNMWGRTIECGDLEDPMIEPASDIWELTREPSEAPRTARYLEIGFERGTPVSVDGAKVTIAQAVDEVGRAAGEYGFGRVDMIEDRVVGIKSREIYEVPGALALIAAHSDLEELTVERELIRTKRSLELRYAQMVYEGLWYSSLREALDAFIESASQPVSGTVRLKLEAGSVRPVGRSSPDSLYDLSLATYDTADAFDHAAGAGFVKIWGLPSKVWGRTRKGKDGTPPRSPAE